MRLILTVKDIGKFDIAIQPGAIKNLDDENLSKIRSLISSKTESLYLQLSTGEYLFLSKNLIDNSYMILDPSDAADLK
jgi:hypothetical protein